MGELEDLLAKYEDPGHVPQVMKKKPVIMVVDDDASIRRGLHRILSEDYAVRLAESALDGIKNFTSEVACIILDVKMKEMTGFAAYYQFKTLDPFVPIIFYTAYQSEHDLSQIINTYKPEGYVEKGANIHLLRNLIKQAIEKCFLHRKNDRQKKELQAAVDEMQNEIKRRREIEKELKQNEKRVRVKNSQLEETNVTLKVLLKQIKDGGKEFEENILINVKKTVLPYIMQLRKSDLNGRQLDLLVLIEANLKNLVSPFIKSLNNDYFQLTPGETRVADLVRSGQNTKDIAAILSLSPRTIEAYRESIREKTGIKKKNVNLRTHLQSFK